MSESSFRRNFQVRSGLAPLEFLTRHQIEAAAYRLLREDTAIKCIAYEPGFTNLDSFRRAFRKYNGLSAANYRKSRSGFQS